jgi:hypothetical protein
VARGRALSRAHLGVEAGEPDLLGPDGEGPRLPRYRPSRLTREQVGHPHEPGDEPGGGALVHIRGGPRLFDAALVHHGQAVAHGQGLLLIVGDVDEGEADPALDRLQLDLHLLAELEVESTQRLVQQEDARLVHQGPGQGHPLPLAARQLLRLAPFEPHQADHAQGLGRPLTALPGRDPLDHQPVLDVLAHRHVGEQGVVLEHRVDVALVGRQVGDVLALEEDPPGGRKLEAGHQAQAGGLPGARWPEDGEELSFPDREVDAVDGRHASEALGHRPQLHGGHGEPRLGLWHRPHRVHRSPRPRSSLVGTSATGLRSESAGPSAW